MDASDFFKELLPIITIILSIVYKVFFEKKDKTDQNREDTLQTKDTKKLKNNKIDIYRTQTKDEGQKEKVLENRYEMATTKDDQGNEDFIEDTNSVNEEHDLKEEKHTIKVNENHIKYTHDWIKGKNLIQGVIMKEILSKPKALRKKEL